MFGPGSESFPESQERPEGTVSVRWQGSEDALPVDVVPNLVYQALSGEEQRIQLFLPMPMPLSAPLPGAPAEKRPLVVYVPGSAWHRQNVWMGLDKARYFAARGFAFAIVEYRPSELSPFPAQIEDAGAAVRFLLERSEEYRLDGSRLVLWGDSSGAHTVVSLAVRFPELARCVVDWFGPMDIIDMNYYPSGMDHHGPDSPEGFLIGRKDVLENPELARRTSPLTGISPERKLPPMLVMHGSMDNVVPFHQSVLLVEKLRSCGQAADFYRLEGSGHGTGGFTSEEALQTTLEWVKARL